MMFDTGEIQEIEDILIHKEQRANLQSNLLSKYSNSSLMVFTLNIPGPIKNNPMIEQVFRQGQQSIQQMFLKKGGNDVHKRNQFAKWIGLVRNSNRSTFESQKMVGHVRRARRIR